MKYSIAIATLASAMSISAFPLFSLHKREVGGVLLCTGANSTGTCSYEVYKLNECHQLKAPFYHNTSTFAPDGENFYCYPRTTSCNDTCRSPTGCTFGQVDYNYEHKSNLTAIEWNNLISSFDCKLKKKSSTS